MTSTDLELEIRRTLAAQASAYLFPQDLPSRTFAAVRAASAAPPRRPRNRRWVYALAVVAVLPAFFLVGVLAAHRPMVQRGASSLPAVAPLLPGSTASGGQSGGGADFGLLNPGLPGPVPADAGKSGPPAGDLGQGFQASVLRTASVEVQVNKGQFPAAGAQATAVAARYVGLVSDSNAQTSSGRLARGVLTLRVPADKLDAAIGDLQRLGTTVSLMTSSQDVSGQVADLDARLHSLQAQEAQYLQLLPAAKSTTDILEIRTRLDSVRQEIESLQGRQKFLQSQVDLARIQATIAEPGTDLPVMQPEGRFANAWQRAKEGVAAVVAGFIIAVGYLAAPAVLALVVWLVVRRRRRVL
ncbi:MAG: hypothetical protein NVSMB32_11330 [Actinomycetota bacterium]